MDKWNAWYFGIPKSFPCNHIIFPMDFCLCCAKDDRAAAIVAGD